MDTIGFGAGLLETNNSVLSGLYLPLIFISSQVLQQALAPFTQLLAQTQTSH
jgi:hypothetical protein